MLYGHSGVTGNDCTLLASIAAELRGSLPSAVSGSETAASGVLLYGNGNAVNTSCTPVVLSGDATVSGNTFTPTAEGELTLLLKKTVSLGSYGSYVLLTQPIPVTAATPAHRGDVNLSYQAGNFRR